MIPENQTYALATLSEVQDYRGLNYRYFLLTSSHPPVRLEEFGGADVLVVVAENPRDARNVLGSPVYEIVTFPRGSYRTVEVDNGPLLYFISRQNE